MSLACFNTAQPNTHLSTPLEKASLASVLRFTGIKCNAEQRERRTGNSRLDLGRVYQLNDPVHRYDTCVDSCHQFSQRDPHDINATAAVNGMTGEHGSRTSAQRRWWGGPCEQEGDRKVVERRARNGSTATVEDARSSARGPIEGRTRRQVNAAHYLPL